MLLTCYNTITNSKNEQEERPVHINMNQVCTINPCSGQKKDRDGFLTVMYTPNGQALYSKLTPETIVRGMQGEILTEEKFEGLVAAHDAQLAGQEAPELSQ